MASQPPESGVPSSPPAPPVRGRAPASPRGTRWRRWAARAALGVCALAAFAAVGVLSWADLGGKGPSTDAPATRPVATSGKSDTPRIAALLPFAADQLLAMGVRPVAAPSIRGRPPASWEGIATVALDHSAGPNLEQLIASRPDVIVTSGVYEQFLPMVERSTGAEVVVMDVTSIEDVADHTRRLAELAGLPEAADGVIDGLGVDAALASPPAGAGSPSQYPSQNPSRKPVEVLAVLGTPHSFYAFLPGSYLGDLVRAAGGRLITQDLASHAVYRGLAPISMEAIIARDPEQVIVVFHGPEASAKAMLEGDPLWSGLRAVAGGAVAYLDDDLYTTRQGSELPRALREVRAIVRGALERR